MSCLITLLLKMLGQSGSSSFLLWLLGKLLG